MVFATLIGAIIDVAGLAALVPVMMAATNPEMVQTNKYLNAVYTGLGFESYPGFMMFLAVALLAVFLFKNGVALYLNYAHSRFAYSIATSVARRQYIKYYERGFQYFKTTNSADIINHIVNIPSFFASGVVISSINIVGESMVMLFIVFGIALVDVALFVAVMGVLIPSGIIIYSASKNRLYQLGLEQQELHGATFSRLNQAIFGFVDVKLNNKESFFLDAYVEKQLRLNNNQKVKYLISLVPTRALEVIAILGIVVIFAYSFFFANDPTKLFGFIALFAAAAFRVLPSMNRLLNALMGMKNHQPALEILEEGGLPLDMKEQSNAPVPFVDEIEFRDLHFTYEGAEIPSLRGLSFKVKKGEKIGIVGESGSGKTTLVNVLLRFLPESQGGIYVDGKKLTETEVRGWRRLVGYVQQKVYLMDASLKENVAFGQLAEEIDIERLEWALKQASLWDFVQSLPEGYNGHIGEMGAKLSGGQQQRIGIARALYWKNEVLVFDEATSALDMETETMITDSIENLAGGQTLFVIAHRITTLKHCDRIMEMRDGLLVKEWKYEDLVKERLGGPNS